MAMGVDITKAACKCEQDHKDDTTFIIVTGDRDFKSPVEGVMEEGVKVELWGWKHGISIQYRKLANESSLFTLNTLDDIASEFSFTSYKSTREACDIDAAKALVFKDIPNGNKSLDNLAGYLLCLKRLFYTTSLPHDDKQYQDVIVAFPKSKPDVVLKQIEAVKSPYEKPISYPTYISEKRQKNQLVPTIELKNRYESLGDVDDDTTVEAFQGSLGVNIEEQLLHLQTLLMKHMKHMTLKVMIGSLTQGIKLVFTLVGKGIIKLLVGGEFTAQTELTAALDTPAKKRSSSKCTQTPNLSTGKQSYA